MKRIRTAGAAVLALCAPFFSPVAARAAVDCSAVPWMNTRKTAEQRAAALLAASTQHQKYRWLVEQPANSPAQTEWQDGVVYPVQVPCTPTVVYADGPDGVRFTPGVTAFPATIAQAATWNESLAYAKGKTQAAEAFDKRKNMLLAPGLCARSTTCRSRSPSTGPRRRA